MSTTINDVQVMGAYEVEDKAFIAFERRSAEASGVYYHVFDKKNGSAVEPPETVFANAQKVIEPSVYDNRDLHRIFLYSNKIGDDVTITLITRPRPGDNFTYVHTGRIVWDRNNNRYNYVACSDPARVGSTFESFFGFYYNNNTKNKFILFSNGVILPEAH